MAQDFKNVFHGLNAQQLEKHVRDGIWYPSRAWGIVKDRQLARAFLAGAQRRLVSENVEFLMDLAKVPIYDTSLSMHQRAHFYQTYFREGVGIYATGGAPLLLNLPSHVFEQARGLFAAPTSPLGQLKNRIVGPSGSLSIMEFLVRTAHSVCLSIEQNDDVRTFWASPEFGAIHADKVAQRRQLAAAAAAANAQSKTPTRPHPVVRFK